MKLYNKKQWKIKREYILRRYKYMCKECERFGKRVDADTVHHIYPVEFYPQYAMSNWNLISLCNKCHNEMHDRKTHQLTQKGEKLKNKTIPPT